MLDNTFMWIKDPQTKEESVSVTLLVVGFVPCLLKLLTSGVTYGSINLGTFSGSDFAIAVGALAALYWGRRHTDSKYPDKE